MRTLTGTPAGGEQAHLCKRNMCPQQFGDTCKALSCPGKAWPTAWGPWEKMIPPG